MLNSSRIDVSAPLRELAALRRLPVGTCVDMAALAGDPEYAAVLAREFDMVVAENAFKPHSVWMGPREYDFSQTNRLAEFASRHHMTLRGHTLLWHQSVPKWLRTAPVAQIPGLVREYIHAIVGRYRGVITVWDVVNEALTDGEASGMRTESFWYKTLGPDYVRLAFTWAHEADPDVRLFYNDYEAEDMGAKSNAVFGLVKELKSLGVPIHGVGLQAHLINGWRASEDNRTNVRRIAGLGLEWQVTEADIRMQLEGNPPSDEQVEVQAAGYRDLMELCLTEPGCTGFVTWGFSDAHSWIPGFRKGWGAALPFDIHFRPKPAYLALSDALRGC